MLDVYQACVKGLFLSWSYWKVLELSKIGPQWGLWEWMMDSRFYISFSLGSLPPGEHLLSTTPTPCLFHDVLSYTRFKSNDAINPALPTLWAQGDPFSWSLVCVTVTEVDWHIPLRRFSESSHLAIRWWWLLSHGEQVIQQAMKPGTLRLSDLVQSLLLKPNNIQATGSWVEIFPAVSPRCSLWMLEAPAPALVLSGS